MLLKEQLERLMKEHSLNTSKLSKLTNVPNSTLSDWLAGSKPKNIIQVKQVSAFFDVSIDHLCFGEHQQDDELSKYQDEIKAGIFEVVLRRIKE